MFDIKTSHRQTTSTQTYQAIKIYFILKTMKIEITEPTTELIIKLIEGLLDETITRTDLAHWQREVIKTFNYAQFGTYILPIRFNQGYYEFTTFGALELKIETKDGIDYFYRHEDFKSWLRNLKKEGSQYDFGPFCKKICWGEFQATPGSAWSYLCSYSDNKNDTLKKIGLTFDRLIWNELLESTEGIFITFNDWEFSISKVYDPMISDWIIQGESQCPPHVIAKLLHNLGITQENIIWINDTIFGKPCKLTRLDDNNNSFTVGSFSNEIYAHLAQIDYERKGHKQTYFVVDQPA